MQEGGYIRGPWWWYTDDDHNAVRRCFVIAWGHVALIPETRKDYRRISFALKTGRGPAGGKDQYGRPDGHNEKYLVCDAFGESIVSTVIRALERKDIVLCAGQWVERMSQTKKHGRKWTYAMRVNFIFPLGLVGFLLDLYSTPEITAAVERRRNEAPDVWESDGEDDVRI